jgi:hypothetical protein
MPCGERICCGAFFIDNQQKIVVLADKSIAVSQCKRLLFSRMLFIIGRYYL